MKKTFLFFFFIFSIVIVNKLTAQTGVAINTDGTAANASAMLDVKATDKGVLIPRMASTGSVTTPVNGLLVYQTGGTPGFYYYDGSAWIFIQNSGNTNVTLQGNTFNGANQLVQLNGTGLLPALNGSNLTNLPAGAAAPSNIYGSVLMSFGAVTRYYAVGGGVANATEAVIAVRFSAGCILTNLNVSVIDGTTGLPGTGMSQTAMTAGIRINGANAFVCTTSFSSSCTSAGPVTITAGDMVNFFVTGQNNTSNAVLRISARCQY